MNAKQFWKLNPNFKFNRIFLYNQSKFNNLGSMKKFIFPIYKAYSNNKYKTEFKEDKNLDYLTQNLISEYKSEYSKETYPSISQNKNKTIKYIRAKMANNNNILKEIDFNINNCSDEKNNSLELNINQYETLPQRNKKSKNIINLTENNNNGKIKEIMKIRTKNKNKMNRSFDGMKKDKENIKLPYVSTQINRRRYNIQLFNKKNENIETCANINVIDKKDQMKNDKQRDIFKNVNYFLDNKKTKLKVYDIERIILDIKNINNSEEDRNNEYFESIFINTKIPRSEEKVIIKKKESDINKINDNNLLIDEDTLKRKEKEKYMIYEKNKKFIEKKKIYNPMKYGQASIPNLSLDKGFKNVKKFEQAVINMKKTQIDLPFFIKTKQII